MLAHSVVASSPSLREEAKNAINHVRVIDRRSIGDAEWARHGQMKSSEHSDPFAAGAFLETYLRS